MDSMKLKEELSAGPLNEVCVDQNILKVCTIIYKGSSTKYRLKSLSDWLIIGAAGDV